MDQEGHIASEVTVAELDKFSVILAEKKAAMDSLQAQIDNIKESYDQILNTVGAYLDEIGKTKWDFPGGVIEVRSKTSVRIPRSEDDKKLFFEWLTQKGIYWETVGVNSQTLNALYKEEFENSIKLGQDCKIPGISDPEIYKQIVLKRK